MRAQLNRDRLIALIHSEGYLRAASPTRQQSPLSEGHAAFETVVLGTGAAQ